MNMSINTKNFFKKYVVRNVAFIAIALIAIVVVFTYAFIARNNVGAQASIAQMIGGKTQGVQQVCCNGLILGFESVNSAQPLILDGEAIYMPGLSASFSYYLESASSSCSLGKLLGQVPCLDPGEECASSGSYPLIATVGTSAVGCEYLQ